MNCESAKANAAISSQTIFPSLAPYRPNSLCAVRSQPDKLKPLIVGFSVDENQIRFDMAVPVIFPVTRERMIAMLCHQWPVIGQIGNDLAKIALKCLTMLALGFPLIVASELACRLNRPHSNQPSGLQPWQTT